MFTICIPTYKNRENNILYRLNEFSSERKIKIFLYESDFEKSVYDEFEFAENVEVIKVSDEYLTIQKMRKFIQKEMKKEVFWMIDDDVIIKEDQLVAVEKVFTPDMAIISPAFSTPVIMDLIIKFPVQAVLFNGELLWNNGIKYSGDYLHEDIEITYKACKKNLPIVIDMDVRYELVPVESTLSDYEQIRANTIAKFGRFKFDAQYIRDGVRKTVWFIH